MGLEGVIQIFSDVYSLGSRVKGARGHEVQSIRATASLVLHAYEKGRFTDKDIERLQTEAQSLLKRLEDVIRTGRSESAYPIQLD